MKTALSNYARQGFAGDCGDVIVLTKQDKEFSAVRSMLVSRVDGVCQGNVTKEYVLSTPMEGNDGTYTGINAADLLFVSYWSKRGAKKSICSFALVKKSRKGLYVDVICARKGSQSGGKMMQTIINYAKKTGEKGVYLKALPNVVGFYTRYGFKHEGFAKRNDTLRDGFRMLLEF